MRSTTDTRHRHCSICRRLIIISFTQQFFGEKADFYLLEKLSTTEELSGLLYELLRRLPRVLKEGVITVTDEVMEKTYEKYVKGSDPIKYFTEKGIERSEDPRQIVIKRDLYEHHNKFCSYFGLTVQSDQSFSRRLKKDFGYDSDRGKVNSNLEYYWVGIKSKDWEADERLAVERDKKKEVVFFSAETKETLK